MDIERLSQIGSTLDTRLKRKKDTEKSGTGKSGKSGKTAFRSVLGKVAEESAASAEILGPGPLPVLDGSETVESLLDDVHEKGEALKRDSVFGPLNGYKTAVRKFLRYVIENSFEMEESLGIRNPRTMQQKKYIIIRVVDERLESLAAHVLKNQSDQLDILRRIDEIHGMLVDLTG
jgi:uncharacterized protein YaaR (DUF327 family)